MSGSFILGGVLSSVGDYAVEDVRAKREAKLAELDRRYRSDEAQKDRDWRSAESDRDRQERRGLISSTVQDADGRYFGIRPDGSKVDIGVNGKPKGSSTGALNAGDERLLKRVEAMFTDSSGNTDWNGVATHLKKLGRDDLSAAYDTGPRAVDPNDERWLEAGARADEETSAQAGFFSTDKSDFKDDGGNRETFRNRRQQEIYNEMTGRASASSQTASSSSQTAVDDTARQQTTTPAETPKQTAKPQGTGTREDPFVAATQADIDWFKKNAPAGAVLSVNGKLYSK